MGSFPRKSLSSLRMAAPEVETLPIPTPVTGLDRYNARRALAAVRSGAERGMDRPLARTSSVLVRMRLFPWPNRLINSIPQMIQ